VNFYVHWSSCSLCLKDCRRRNFGCHLCRLLHCWQNQ